jgi:hypothetical protein
MQNPTAADSTEPLASIKPGIDAHAEVAGEDGVREKHDRPSKTSLAADIRRLYLAAAMPEDYRPGETDWGREGAEVW